MKIVVLGITGSIAAYKAADIANNLVKLEYDVHTVMTEAGASFITPLTLQALTKNRVYVDALQEDNPKEIIHISLPEQAKMLLIAPATANIIAKIAAGVADDMLTSMVLAVHGIPKLIAPAMNTRMYENTATQDNLQILTRRGWNVIEPREARLACGYSGKGAMAEVQAVLDAVAESWT